MQGSETITVVPALTKAQTDRNGDPLPDLDDAPEERDIFNCVLIPRTLPEDPTVVIDGYQVVITDTSQDPPAAEDTIKIRDEDKQWFIEGSVGDYTKLSGDIKAFIFVIQSVR